MMAIELVADKGDDGVLRHKSVDAQTLFQSLALKNGLAMYSSLYGAARHPAMARGLPIWVAPPLSIDAGEVDEMMGRLLTMLSEWESAVL